MSDTQSNKNQETMYDALHAVLDRKDTSYVDKAIAAEALERWFKYQGDDACALDLCGISMAQWRFAAITKSSCTPSQELISILEHWSGCYDDDMSRAIASEMLAEYYDRIEIVADDDVRNKTAVDYWERAALAWRELHYHSLDTEMSF